MDVPLPEWQAPPRPAHECVEYFYMGQAEVVVMISLTLRSISGQCSGLKMVEYVRVEILSGLQDGAGPAGIVASESSWKDTKFTLLSELPLRCPLRSSIRQNTDNVRMIPDVWSKLPEELLMRIIAMLPLQSLLRARSVCKVWTSLIYDPNFGSRALSLRAQPTDDPPLCMLSLQNDEYMAYNPTSNVWHILPASFIPTQCDVAPFCRSLVSNAGSLLLLRGIDHRGRSFFVVNPLNNSERRLPSLPSPRVDRLPSMNLPKCDAWLVENKLTGAFKVLCVEEYIIHHNHKETCIIIFFFHLYDSRSDSWTVKCEPMPDLNMKTIRNVTIYKEYIYCLVERRLVRSVFFPDQHFLVYRVGQEGWEEVEVEMPENLYVAHLLECQGRLMLVGGISDPELMLFGGHSHVSDGASCLLGVDIWQLSPVQAKWVKVQSMPDELLADVSGANPWVDDYLGHFQRYGLHANGSYMMVNNFTAGKTVMCDVSKGIWWLLPPLSSAVSNCALQDYKETTSWFLLEISLRAL